MPRIKLAASNFAQQFISVPGREFYIFVNFATQKPKMGRRIGQRAGHTHHCDISREVVLACVDKGQSPVTYLSYTRPKTCHVLWSGSTSRVN